MPPKISEQLQAAVRLRADFLCEYCHTNERFQLVRFTIDHIVPVSAGGETESENLALACFHCNRRKSALQSVFDSLSGVDVPIYDPRNMLWRDHFYWSKNGTILAATSDIGRVTIDQLQMNRERALQLRSADILIDRHPPQNDRREPT